MAAPGSLYTFVTKGIGPTGGFVTAVAQVVGYGFVAMFGLVGAAFYAQTFASAFLGDWVVSRGVTGLGVVVLAGVCFVVLRRGIQISARVTLVAELLSIVVILVLVAVVATQLSPDSLAKPLTGSLPGSLPAWGDIVAGTTIAITAFVGFESAASLGREAARPFATVSRTMRWTVIGVGLLYVAAAYVELGGAAEFGFSLAGNEAAAVNALADHANIPYVGTLLDVGLATSLLACAVASLTALSRVVFSLGREGVLPRALGRADPLRGTPLVALAVVIPVIVGIPLVMLLSGWTPWETLSCLIAVAAVGYVVSYVLVSAATPVFLRRIGEFTWTAGLVAGLAGALLGVVLAVYLVVLAGIEPVSLWLVGILAAVGLAAYVVARGSIGEMGLFDHTTAEDLLGAGPVERP